MCTVCVYTCTITKKPVLHFELNVFLKLKYSYVQSVYTCTVKKKKVFSCEEAALEVQKEVSE